MSLTLEFVEKQEHKLAGNGEIRINCPECDDTNFKCYVNVKRALYNCYRCGKGGRLSISTEKLVEDYENAKEAYLKYHSEDTRKYLYELEDRKLVGTLIPSKRVVKNLPLHTELTNEALDFLRDRGVTDFQIRWHKIMSSSDGKRVIIPIYNVTRGWVTGTKIKYFVSRSITNDGIKYINAPWPKNDTLFISPEKSTKFGELQPVLCEGVFDAMAIGRVKGFAGVSLLGKRANREQLEEIVARFKTVIIMLDSDAFSHACNLQLQLKAMADSIGQPFKSKIVYKSGYDPADLALHDMKGLKGLLNDARSYLSY